MKATVVKENRSYVKSDGGCININKTAYQTRLAKVAFTKNTDNKLSKLESEVVELRRMIEDMINGNHTR